MPKHAHAFPANVSGPISSHSACVKTLRLGSRVKYLSDRQRMACLVVSSLGLELDATARHDSGSEHVAVKLLLGDPTMPHTIFVSKIFFTSVLNPSTLNASSVYSSSSLSSMASTFFAQLFAHYISTTHSNKKSYISFLRKPSIWFK